MQSRRIAFTAIALVAASAPVASAQQGLDSASLADSIAGEIQRAVILRDLDGLERARALAERATIAFSDDGLLLHYLGMALYRQATFVEGGDRDLAKQAQGVLERAVELGAPPEANALLSTVIGQQIGANPIRGMMMGPKSNAAMERAILEGPENPRVWMLHGTAAIYTPALFGGGGERALERLTKAVELFAAEEPKAGEPAWGHAEVYAWLGVARMNENDYEGAAEAFASALEIEPDFAWVKDVLLKQLEEKQKA